eukprot:Phypoly_transcript_24449.p1 GENE.Phypoly_transcript_24449~~Phypoly_transcript_24449.p1  ORF type:complete len:178 (+),score=26.79 Phypoly_transcript_24449:58-534(+)
MRGYFSLTITIPELKLGMIILQSSDAYNTLNDIFALWTNMFITPFAQMVQKLAPAPFIPPNFKEFIGTYELFNGTYQISIVPSPPYNRPIISTVAGTFDLVYISENFFRISGLGLGMPLSCETLEEGFEQYLYLIPSDPPSFSIPGQFPGQQAVFKHN